MRKNTTTKITEEDLRKLHKPYSSEIFYWLEDSRKFWANVNETFPWEFKDKYIFTKAAKFKFE